MTERAVVIAAAGPTGLMSAGELALAGVDGAIVERRASQDLAGSCAGGLHARTIEILDQRGIADRFLAQGQLAQVAGFAWIPPDISRPFPPAPGVEVVEAAAPRRASLEKRLPCARFSSKVIPWSLPETGI